MMNEFISWLANKEYSPVSVQKYQYSVRQFMGWLATKNVLIENVSYSRLIDYLSYLKAQEQSTAYRTNQLQGIRHYFSYLIEKDKINHNPAEGLQIKGITRHLPHQWHKKEELKDLFTGYTNHPNQATEVQLIVSFMVFQGLRPREIARLQKQDIDLKRATVFVEGDKRAASRTLALESVQFKLLQGYLLNISDLLIEETQFNAKRLKAESYLKQSGVQKLQHIRASVISSWVKECNLREAQYRAGHKYVSSTERYLQSQPEALQQAVAQFHPLR